MKQSSPILVATQKKEMCEREHHCHAIRVIQCFSHFFYVMSYIVFYYYLDNIKNEKEKKRKKSDARGEKCLFECEEKKI